MAQSFITLDNQILMVCTGDEIEIVRMDGNPIYNIIQVHNHMIQSQRRSGKLNLKMADSQLDIIRRRYMVEVGVNQSRYSEYLSSPYPPTLASILALATETMLHTYPFELAIVEGDTTDKSTWKVQITWEGCLVDEKNFETQPTLNNDALVMHTLPIDFADMQYYCEDKDCSSLLSDTPG